MFSSRCVNLRSLHPIFALSQRLVEKEDTLRLPVLLELRDSLSLSLSISLSNYSSSQRKNPSQHE